MPQNPNGYANSHCQRGRKPSGLGAPMWVDACGVASGKAVAERRRIPQQDRKRRTAPPNELGMAHAPFSKAFQNFLAV